MRNSCWGPSSADGSCHPPRAWENGRASGRGEACTVISEAGCCFMSACQGSLVTHRITNGKAHLGRGLQGVQMHVHGSADVSLERPVPAVTCLLRGACGPLLGQRGRAWTVRSASYFPDSAPAQASAKTGPSPGPGPGRGARRVGALPLPGPTARPPAFDLPPPAVRWACQQPHPHGPLPAGLPFRAIPWLSTVRETGKAASALTALVV